MKVCDFYSLSESFKDEEEFLSNTLSSLIEKLKPGDSLLLTVDYLNQLGRSSQANDLIDYCRDLWPDDHDFLFLAAYQNSFLGHYQYSIDLLGKIIEVDPNFFVAYELIAKNFCLSGNFEQCAQILHANAPSISYQTQTFLCWIEALIHLGRYEDALRTAFSASKRFPEVTDFRVACTECLIRLGHCDQVVGLFDDQCQWTQKIAANLLIELGIALFLNDQHDGSSLLYKLAESKVEGNVSEGLKRGYVNYQMMLFVSDVLPSPIQAKESWRDANNQAACVVDCRGLDLLSTIAVCLNLNKNRLQSSSSCLVITPYDVVLEEYFSRISFASEALFAQEINFDQSEISALSILVADDFDQNFLVAVSAALKGCVSGINLSATSFDSLSGPNDSEILIIVTSDSSIQRCQFLLQLDTDQVHGVAEKNSVSELQLPHSLVQMTSNDVKPSLSAKWQLAHCLHRIGGCQKVVTDDIQIATMALLLGKSAQFARGSYTEDSLQWHWLLNVDNNSLGKMLHTSL